MSLIALLLKLVKGVKSGEESLHFPSRRQDKTDSNEELSSSDKYFWLKH